MVKLLIDYVSSFNKIYIIIKYFLHIYVISDLINNSLDNKIFYFVTHFFTFDWLLFNESLYTFLFENDVVHKLLSLIQLYFNSNIIKPCLKDLITLHNINPIELYQINNINIIKILIHNSIKIAPLIYKIFNTKTLNNYIKYIIINYIEYTVKIDKNLTNWLYFHYEISLKNKTQQYLKTISYINKLFTMIPLQNYNYIIIISFTEYNVTLDRNLWNWLFYHYNISLQRNIINNSMKDQFKNTLKCGNNQLISQF